jgi:uncharacterized protein DUF4082/Big-like domain-containing protein/IPT/TIG domain-containing protein
MRTVRHSQRRLAPLLATVVLTALLWGTLPVAAQSSTTAAACPCSIWGTSVTPATPQFNDAQAIEVGVKFQSDSDGYITAIRFYKGSSNSGTHFGHLWKSDGTMLAEVIFTGESASGWQEIAFGDPVAITANTTYVASYHTNAGWYAVDTDYFATSAVDNPPLHARRSGVDGPNGVYKYGASAFPTDSFRSSNYWVDVVFNATIGPDVTPPTVIARTPAPDETGVGVGTLVSVTFSEPIDSATMNGTTFGLSDSAGSVVPGTVTYDTPTRTATFDPTSSLTFSKAYTATVQGGPNGVKDLSDNALAADSMWTFTTGAKPPPPPEEGPGGRILIISQSTDPFGRYYAEILRAEGLNEFAATDINTITAATLSSFDVVILAPGPVSGTQVSMLSDWVNAGGNLIAMRPDKQLAGLLGLTDGVGTLPNAYLKVETASGPGVGIVAQTMQYQGTADRYALNGATSVATLYSTDSTATTHPAVTLRGVGDSGGQAAAFAYDLARSVVYTRQGNPAWAGQERDGISPIRPDDLFYGAKSGDVQPDWVDLNKVAIPQADEQQRLLANLITQMDLDRVPLPRFWYLPRGDKAVVLMTGDDHASGGTAGRFDTYKSMSPPGCSVDAWECVRASSYIYTNTPLTNAQAASYDAAGFEVGLHVNTGCADWTPASLESFFAQQLSEWSAKYSSLPMPDSQRTHCIAWSDWVTQPRVELAHGLRLDTNYYYWPPTWVQDRPGLFTGSAMPMRFADQDGTMVDVYQATTQMTDESGQSYPFTIDTLLDRALGPQGYYGVFTANMHTDSAESQGSDAIVSSALSRGVPVVSGRQLLEWLDGRNGSSFDSVAWTDNQLTFDVVVGSAANGLQAMIPVESSTGPLMGITSGGNPVQYTIQTIKGIDYAFFAASPASYVATYESTSHAPTIASFTPAAGTVKQVVTITGTRFTGAITVAFNGTGAQFQVNSDTQIRVRVPAGATTGPITVSTSGGTAASSTSFRVRPKIDRFSPTSGSVGTMVTILGSGFTGATRVAFNGRSAVFTVVSSTKISATVPASATTGRIKVFTAGGSVASASSFMVT